MNKTVTLEQAIERIAVAFAAGKGEQVRAMVESEVERLHAAQYPDGCPSRCEECVARVPAPGVGCW
jgi:hypothetical protein